MQAVVLIAVVLGATPLPDRFARSLPCAPRFVPTTMRAAPERPRVERPALAPRRDAPRRAPCFRLAAA